jgi:hypothetical protein
VRLEGLGKFKNFNYPIETQTSDFAACSLEPQPNALPHAPSSLVHIRGILVVFGWLFNDCVGCHYYTASVDRRSDDRWIDKDCEGNSHGLIQVLFWDFSGQTKEIYEEPKLIIGVSAEMWTKNFTSTNAEHCS